MPIAARDPGNPGVAAGEQRQGLLHAIHQLLAQQLGQDSRNLVLHGDKTAQTLGVKRDKTGRPQPQRPGRMNQRFYL